MSEEASARFLREVLYGNAVFSGVSGGILLLMPSTVSAWLGLSLPGLLMGVGLALLGYAGALVAVANKAPTSGAVWGFVGLDAAWVAGSFSVLSAGTLLPDPTGRALVSVVALVVMLFAGLQTYGMGILNDGG